ncbi:hypothetical protein OCU04_004871 [Sclerotinia nivalis]|uniref:Uncharacterized protein n=1 Tax=Sclerotinia nivalis TaxID=352851 RepID=A0A9X0ARF0_9HELO|nr:hypothetical protein OCU04_004871 [Sclerotinia nivalis]
MNFYNVNRIPAEPPRTLEQAMAAPEAPAVDIINLFPRPPLRSDPRLLQIPTGTRPPLPRFNASGRIFAWAAPLTRGARQMVHGFTDHGREEIQSFREEAIFKLMRISRHLRRIVESGSLRKSDQIMLQRALCNLYHRNVTTESSFGLFGFDLDSMFFWKIRVRPGCARQAVELLRAIGAVPTFGFELEAYRHNFQHRGTGFMAGPYSMYGSFSNFRYQTRDPRRLPRDAAPRQMVALPQRARRHSQPILRHDTALTQTVASPEGVHCHPEPTDVVFDHGYNAELDILSDPDF